MSTIPLGLASLWTAIAMFIEPTTAQVSQHIDLAADNEEIVLFFEDSEITITPVLPHSASSLPTSIVVKMPGNHSVSVILGESAWINYGQWIGAIRLEPSDPAITAFLEAYSAGAHCCSMLVAISEEENSHLTVNGFPPAEGEIRAELPKDIDGDGILDIFRVGEHICDDAGECSSRTAIYNLREGKLLDVTELPKFRRILEMSHQRRSRK